MDASFSHRTHSHARTALLRLRFCVIVLSLVVLAQLAPPADTLAFPRPAGGAVTVNEVGCQSADLNRARNGESFAGPVRIGFPVDFFGRRYDELFVNMDGNVTFGAPLGEFDGSALSVPSGTPMIAPFLADVDTFDPNSGLVHFGRTSYRGRPAFCVDWFTREPGGGTTGVGYHDRHTDKLNVFQALLVDRGSTGRVGDFDVIFNYDSLVWESGDSSGGTRGLSGLCAVAGFSDGSGTEAGAHTIAGSSTCGAFLDSAPTGLANTTNSPSREPEGRWVFPVRAGAVIMDGLPHSVPTTVSARIAPEREGVALGGEPIIVEGSVNALYPEEVPTGGVRLVVGGVADSSAPSARVDAQGRFTLPAFRLPATPARPFPIQIAYAGDGVFEPSVSPVISLRVYRSDYAIALTSSDNPAPFGRRVAFGASVSHQVPDGSRPDGGVVFAVDGVDRTAVIPVDADGAARWTASLPIGTHDVSARYVPAGDDLRTTQSRIEQRVLPPAWKTSAGVTLSPQPMSGGRAGFRVSGKLSSNAGLAPRRLCSGVITVALNQGSNEISRTVSIGPRCRYAVSLEFPPTVVLGPRKPVIVTATFGGNDDVRALEVDTSLASPLRSGPVPSVADPWVVSLGESYMAGEGGRWAGNTNVWPFLAPDNIDALGPTAYSDNRTNDLTTAPGNPVPGERELIPGCHRSRSAEVFIGSGVKGLNLACSGALTTTHTSGSRVNPGFKPGIDFYLSSAGAGQAALLSEFARSHRVEVVVLSIGGNDFGFGEIIETCVRRYLTSINASVQINLPMLVYKGRFRPGDPRRLFDWKNWEWISVPGPSIDLRSYCSESKKIKALVSTPSAMIVRDRVVSAIQNIALALARQGYGREDYTILVQTAPVPIAGTTDIRYPQGVPYKPLDISTWWAKPRQTVGGCGIWDKDLDWIHNVVVPTFNSTFKKAAATAGELNIPYASTPYKPRVAVLDVQEAFAGRRLCQKGTDVLPPPTSWRDPAAVDRSEWVNQIRTLTAGRKSPYSLQEGLHPNYWGQLALRSCLRQAYFQAVFTRRPQNGVCRRAGAGLDKAFTPPEPRMSWQPS